MKPLRLQNKAGRIALQFSVGGQHYSLYGLGNWNSHSDKAKAETLMRVVESDILEGRFDTTLERYKAGLSRATKRLGTPVEMFAQWMEAIEPGDRNFAIHYEPVLKVLINSPSFTSNLVLLVATWAELSSRTYNDRVGVLKRFSAWLVSEGYLPVNPYHKLRRKPNEIRRIEPFTAEQVKRLFEKLDRP